MKIYPQDTFVVEMAHAFLVGTIVRNVAPYSRAYGKQGEIIRLIPFTFLTPAYDVRYGDQVMIDSERHLERVDMDKNIPDDHAEDHRVWRRECAMAI